MKTLKNINTEVRDDLHELGLLVVEEQVEKRGVYTISAEFTSNEFTPYSGWKTIFKVESTVSKAGVKISTQIVKDSYGYQLKSRRREKLFIYKNKEKFKKEFRDYLIERHFVWMYR